MSKEFQERDYDLGQFQLAIMLSKVFAGGLAIGVFFISKYIFFFFTFAMMPTIAAILVEKYNKCASATICTFNLIGVLPFLYEIWISTSMDATARKLFADMYTWVSVYTAAFIGQLLIWTLPDLVAKLYVAKAQLKVRSLKSKRDTICEDWGILPENEDKENN